MLKGGWAVVVPGWEEGVLSFVAGAGSQGRGGGGLRGAADAPAANMRAGGQVGARTCKQAACIMHARACARARAGLQEAPSRMQMAKPVLACVIC